MQGFQRAQQEYESKLFDPYGDEPDEGLTKEEYLGMEADAIIEERLLSKDD